jgi:L-threonylcarbamoyladenylate synthase
MLNSQEIERAAAILRAGGLVAIPTETVYGLGADARNPEAVARVFAAKQRPYSHPLIVHVADMSKVHDFAVNIPEEAYKLAEAFWPGPLTMVFKKRGDVLDTVTGAQDTVAVRVPRHPVALALLRTFGGGVVAPSANRFTRVSPTSAAAVRAELGAAVDMVLDGGQCEVGLESTILDLSGDTPCVLRPGMISTEALAKIIGRAVTVRRQDYPSEIRVPGMHHLHYAPETRTVLMRRKDFAELKTPQEESVCLTHSVLDLSHHYPHLIQIRMPSDASEYAHELYARLRALDQKHYAEILVEAVPETPEWEAIRDRLAKACGTKKESHHANQTRKQ